MLVMGYLLSCVQAAAGTPVHLDRIDRRVRFGVAPFPARVRPDRWTLVSCSSLYFLATAITLGLRHVHHKLLTGAGSTPRCRRVTIAVNTEPCSCNTEPCLWR